MARPSSAGSPLWVVARSPVSVMSPSSARRGSLRPSCKSSSTIVCGIYGGLERITSYLIASEIASKRFVRTKLKRERISALSGLLPSRAAALRRAMSRAGSEMSASVNFGSCSAGTRSSSRRVFATAIAIQPLPVHISQIVKRFSPRASIIERITSTARSTKISVSGFGIKTSGVTIKS